MKPTLKSEPKQKPQPLIVLTLEGLAASSLGCFGSSWNVTSTIDRIASQGVLWDRMIATDDDPLAVFRQWCTDHASLDAFRLIGSVELITDDPTMDTDEFEDLFDVVVFVDPEQMPDGSQAAESIEQTQLAQLILLAIERCRDPEPLGVLWLHSRFLSSRWDAPRDLIPPEELDDDIDTPSEETELLPGDEAAPETSESLNQIPFLYDGIDPPNVVIDDKTHPDVVTSWMRTYACQIRLVDELLDFWLAAAEDQRPHLMIGGTSGFALGQNGWIGHQVGPLRTADIRLPVIVRKSTPGHQVSTLRVPSLTPSTSIAAVICELRDENAAIVSPEDWCSDKDEFQPILVTKSSRASTAITTGKWFCVDGKTADELSSIESPSDICLFLKPDDIDDVNDVGRIRTDVIGHLKAIARPK